MKLDKQQFHYLLALLATVYAPSVLAADMIMGPLDIPLVKYGYVAFMGTWGSIASLLHKFSKGTINPNWKLHAANHIVNSNLAAMVVFLGCDHMKYPAGLSAILYSIGGFGGARTMDWLYKKAFATGDAVIDAATGVRAPVPVEPMEDPTPTPTPAPTEVAP